jgi:hypothetical protein
LDKGYDNLFEEYEKLKTQNNKLNYENEMLKKLIIENSKKQLPGSLIKVNPINPTNNYPKLGKVFYIQIILGISIIILSLGFHLLYLAVTSCLMYTDGDFSCWIVNWLGIDLHASFYLDLMLYLLIIFQVILIILLIRNTFNKSK